MLYSSKRHTTRSGLHVYRMEKYTTMKEICSWEHWKDVQRNCDYWLFMMPSAIVMRAFCSRIWVARSTPRLLHVCVPRLLTIAFRRSFYRVALVGSAKTPSTSKARTTSSAHLQVERTETDIMSARLQGFAHHRASPNHA